jgi:hypothetical protein
MLEVDAISVHKGQSFFTDRYRAIPIPPNSCDHSSMIQDQVDSLPPRSRTSICLGGLGAPSGIAAFHPDHPGILMAFINSVVHSHLRWGCHVSITAR